MTAEEIKACKRMREVIESYGVKVRRDGLCCCPIHKEKHPSMKVYKDSYYCFACGATGDVFDFVMRMDNCDFKTAFLLLGGTYEEHSKTSERALYHIQKAREKKQNQLTRLQGKINDNNRLINIYVGWLKKVEPFSDAWCDCQNALTKCLYIDEELTKEMERMWDD